MAIRHRGVSPRVAIIGSGFSGIAMAVKLKLAGIESFVVFEKSDSVGGVWWDNGYPGAEVDTPSILYSYSFRPWEWSRTHVRRIELLEYLRGTAEEFGLTDHIRLGVEVDRVVWDDDRQDQTVYFHEGSSEHFDVVVSATGLLSDPRYPNWPGLETFDGPTFHTSRWDHSVDLTGKTVAIVGTGSTGCQVVPAIAPTAGKVLMFQREPGWILPKGDKEFSSREREALNSRVVQKIVRWKMLYRREKAQYMNSAWRPGTVQNDIAEAGARAYINKIFADRPDLREAVTPKYPYGGKRPILTDLFYPALLRDNVQLVTRAVERVTSSGVVDVDGKEHPADVLVLSTGFKADFVTTFDVVGRHNVTLNEAWDGDPKAMLGILVPGFPNFFMMYGPNTNGGAIVTHLEAQADYILGAIKLLAKRDTAAIEVKETPSAIFNAIVQQRLAGAAFDVSNNYYKSRKGTIVTQWSDGAMVYVALTKLLRRSTWKLDRGIPSVRQKSAPSSSDQLLVAGLGETTDLSKSREGSASNS